MPKVSRKMRHGSQALGDQARELAQVTYTNARDKTRATYGAARDATQSTYRKAESSGLRIAEIILAAGVTLLEGILSYNRQKRRARRWQDTVQDTVQPAWSKTQNMLQMGMDTTQNLLGRNPRKRARKQTRRQLARLQSNAQDVAFLVRDKTQDALQTGMGMTQNLLSRNVKSTRKNLKKARKRAQRNLSTMQASTLQNIGAALAAIGAGLAATQDMWRKGSIQANKNLQKATRSARSFRDDLQYQYKRRQRKRQAARTRFRVGLVAGIVLALLYAPLSGSETRHRLAQGWRQLKDSLGFTV